MDYRCPPSRIFSPRKGSGFTLLETLIALGISAILMTQVLPGFNGLIQSMRIKGLTGNLERTLRLARQEAILRRAPTRICPSTDSLFCSNDADWSAGWIVYVDAEGSFERDPGDAILSTQPPLRNVLVTYNRGNLISTSSNGRLSQNGTLRICGTTTTRHNVNLVMVRSGRLRLEHTSLTCRG